MRFVGSCPPLPWLLYPSLVLCLTSLLVELSVGTVLWDEKREAKNWPRVVTVTGWKANDLVPLFPQTSRQTYTCMSTLLPLYVLCNKLNTDPQIYVPVEIRGVVAKIWWSLERGAGNGCIAPPQIVKVFSVFGQVHRLCAVGWKVVALLKILSVQRVGICWL